ncbi:hypothetical protein TYRP_009870 [Tyrophagus putrescentiae]|nr:hypothetical protein TYRP_009870 [Tyrophagus putrescentiae]
MLKIWSSLASSTADFFLWRGTKRPRLADSEEAEATATTMARAATAAPAAVSASDTVLASIESSAPQSKVNNNCDDAAAAAASAEKNTTRPNQAFLSNGVFSDADSAKEDNSSLCGDDYLTDDDDDDEQFAESVSELVAFRKTIRNVVDEA